MVQKVKDRIISGLIMVVTGIAVSLFSVGYTNNKSDAKILDKKINSIELNKLDKAEYRADQKSRWENHDKVHSIQYDIIKETNEKVNWLYQNEISKRN